MSGATIYRWGMDLRRALWFAGRGIGLLALAGCIPRGNITQEELARRTRELSNAVAVGDKAPWKKYFADDCIYFDEKGRNMSKEALIVDIAPLPKGFSGTITMDKVQSRIERDVAILSYDLDENANVFGQAITARYHQTDTWLRRNHQWKIVASQVLRYYQDPAAGIVGARELRDYVGTYELAPGETMTITQEGNRLFRQRGAKPKGEMIPEADAIFFRRGVEGRTLFRRAANGEVDALIDRRNNEDLVWKKIRK